MAGIRGILRIKYMPKLVEFLNIHGYRQVSTKGTYEYARFYHDWYEPIILFFRNCDDLEDLETAITVQKRDMDMLKGFFTYLKKAHK